MFAILQALMLYAKAQCIINTIAGTGIQGFSGDNAVATGCEFHNSISVTFDKTGSFYVADLFNNRIRKINTLGIITTIAGNGTAGYSGDNAAATSAELNNPIWVTTDDTGNIYISDYLNSSIRKVNTVGVITTIAGTGTAGYSGDNGLAVNAQLNYPTGLLFYQSALYIADIFNNRIRKIDISGVITTIAGTGTAGYGGDNGQATLAKLNGPADIIFDKVGNLYLTDLNNNRVRKINTSGIITTIAGSGTAGYSGNNGSATTAELNQPSGIICDWLGNIYISEQLNNIIRKIDTAGIISLIAGTDTGGYNGDNIIAATAELNEPAGLAFDTTGNLYIADNFNNRIRKVTNVGQMAGIARVQSSNAKTAIYPNPNAGSFTVSYAGSGNQLSIEIYTTLGSLIISKQNTIENNLSAPAINNLEEGTYMVRLTVDGNPVRIERIVVTK